MPPFGSFFSSPKVSAWPPSLLILLLVITVDHHVSAHLLVLFFFTGERWALKVTATAMTAIDMLFIMRYPLVR